MRSFGAFVCLVAIAGCATTPGPTSGEPSDRPLERTASSRPSAAEPIASEGLGSEPAKWRPVAAGPLSPRHGARAFSTSSLVYVVGGSNDDPCPPTVDCVGSGEPPMADGAVYDLATDSWTALPASPVPLGYLSGTILDDRLYVWVGGTERGAGMRSAFLSVRAGDDAWQEHAPPPVAPMASIGLAAAGGQILAFHGSHEHGAGPDLVYSPASDTWQELPQDPLAPSFDRQVVSTDAGVVLLATPLVPDPGSERPALLQAAVLDPEGITWRRLRDSEILCCGGPWHWTGDRLANGSIGSADGGRTNGWDRAYPYGGTLDPMTDSWRLLPDPPQRQGPRPGLSAGGAGWVVGLEGWALDLETARWAAVPNTPIPTQGGVAEAWVGDRLFAWGGYRLADGKMELLDQGWTWPH